VEKSTSEFRIHLNGESVATRTSTLDALLVEKGYADAKVATAVNGTFVPARNRAAKALSDGDHIEVVSARQGG
jgi:sulfur carrier protein